MAASPVQVATPTTITSTFTTNMTDFECVYSSGRPGSGSSEFGGRLGSIWCLEEMGEGEMRINL